jgi:acyl carrier protein
MNNAARTGAVVDYGVRTRVADFVVENYLFGDASRLPADDESLVETGIVDSTGILELVEFLEQAFGIAVSDEETIPDNLGSIGNLTRYVTGKKAGASLSA